MPLVLLGPQRLQPTLAGVIARLEIDGPIATVTAGWQEREDEDDELMEHLGGRTMNLRLFQRAEEIFQEDAELFSLHRTCQNRLEEIRGLYRLRLSYAMDAVRALQSSPIATRHLAAETEAAIEEVRQLDQRHLGQIKETRIEFSESSRSTERPAVARHRSEIAQLISECGAVALAGGHVAVLLNRLRLFNLIDLLEERPILAWSAGAMVLGPKVVVFHDSPPQGAGNAEVFEPGLALYSDLLPLPHAKRRLLLSEPSRVALMSRRFESLRCVPLDEGSELLMTAGLWTPLASAVQLSEDGSVTGLTAPWKTRNSTS